MVLAIILERADATMRRPKSVLEWVMSVSYTHLDVYKRQIIGSNTVVKLANVGNRVLIEDDCVLENLSIIYECCVIRKGTVVPPKTIIPPYSEVSGVPGKDFRISSLNSCYKRLIEIEAKELQILGS